MSKELLYTVEHHVSVKDDERSYTNHTYTKYIKLRDIKVISDSIENAISKAKTLSPSRFVSYNEPKDNYEVISIEEML